MLPEIKDDVTEPSFKGEHTRSLRVWHWSTFIVILGSLTTVLFAKVLLNAKHNALLVQTNLQKSNIVVSPDQARSVVHEFSDLVWNWHIYIGYVLSALFLFRIIVEFFQPEKQKVIPALKNSLRYLRMPAKNKIQGRHYLWVKCLYLVFYFSLLVQVCTGLFMAYSDGMADLKALRHTASNIHSVFMWVIIPYIIIHIGGIIFAELGKKDKGVVSDMINGGK